MALSWWFSQKASTPPPRLLLWLYWHRLRRPLARLQGLVEHAAQSGDLHLQCPETGSRHVRALAAAFNSLLSRLRA